MNCCNASASDEKDGARSSETVYRQAGSQPVQHSTAGDRLELVLVSMAPDGGDDSSRVAWEGGRRGQQVSESAQRFWKLERTSGNHVPLVSPRPRPGP